MLGTRISTIAFPMLVLHLYRSPIFAGLITCAGVLPGMLAYIPAGALVDRWDQLWVMLVTEAGRGAALLAVFLALALGGTASLAVLIPAMIIEEVLEVFYVLADRSYLSRIADQDKISDGQASMEARAHAVVLAGRPIGPFLFQLGEAWPFLADAITFCFSMAGLCWLKFSRQVRPRIKQAAMTSLSTEIWDGWRWLRWNKRAALTTSLMASTTLVAQALIMMFLTVAYEDRLSSLTMGLVLAASGAGGGLGALFSKHVTRLSSLNWLLGPAKAYWLQIQFTAWSLVILLLALTGGQPPCMALAMIVLSFTGAIGNIRFGTYLVRNVPSDMQARVTGIGQFLMMGASAIGPLVGGAIVEGQRPTGAAYRLLVLAVLLTAVSFASRRAWQWLRRLSSLAIPAPHARRARGSGAGLADNVHGVSAAQHRQRHVADRSAARGGATLGACVGVAVDVQAGARAVGRLGEEVAAKERVNLRRLPLQGSHDRRVVGQRDGDVRVKPAQRRAKRVAEFPGVPHERLHLGLAELGRPEAGEAAAEALAAANAEPSAGQVKHDACAFKHRDA
jgi:MFS family permease